MTNAQQILHTDDFIGELGKGQIGNTIDISGVDWTIDVSNGRFSGNNDYFKVKGDGNTNYFEGQDIDGECIWISESFSISGYSNIELSIDLSAQGSFDAEDKIDVAIVIDGVEEFLFQSDCSTGSCFIDGIELEYYFKNFTTPINTTGSNAQIKVYMDNDRGSKKLKFTNLEVRDLLLGVGPTIELSRSDMSDFMYMEDDGPSFMQSFTVKASGLNNSATLDAPTNFEISTDGSIFSSSLTLSQTSGFIDETDIYIRLEAGLELGTYSGVLNATSPGATPQEINLNGIVRKPIELFFTEFLHPSDDQHAKYIEIFNAGVTEIDFDAETYYFSSQASGHSPSGPFILSGKIPPKSYYVISSEKPIITNAYNNAYIRTPDIFLPIVANFGDSEDTFFLSTSGFDFDDAINTLFDIYGKLWVFGAGAPWDHKHGHAYRNNPTVKNASSRWIEGEWVIESAATTDMTPGYGDNDYIFDNGWQNLNTGLGNSGNPIGVSTTAQNIFIKSGTATISEDTDIGDLVVRSGATLIIKAGKKLKVQGDIYNDGKIIFESDATGTAVLEEVATNTRLGGSGDFEIQRFIPASNRAFRYLAPSVTTTTSINANWQEGLNNVGYNYPTDNVTGTSNLGTHITGSTTGANGFDATQTGNHSMYEWNITTQEWDGIDNTNTKNFNVGDAYAILIRGDRSTPLNSNDALGPETTLRTTGTIHVSDFEVDNTVLSNTIGHSNLIGNPYQSQVNMLDLLATSNGLNKNTVYIYDPTLGTRGGYATIDLENLIFSPVPSGTDANRYLQPNQAFFVQTTGAIPSLTFTESVKKNSVGQTQTFSTENTSPDYININLKYADQKLVDGVRVVFDNTYSENIDFYDAVKAWNFDESLTIYSKNTALSIEKRPQPKVTDTTQLYLYNYTKSSYTIEVEFITENESHQDIFLNDQYTGQSIAVTPNQLLSYDFAIDPNIPDSVSSDRFLITYETSTLSVDDFENDKIAIYPNPLWGEQLFIDVNQTWIGKKTNLKLFDLSGRLINTWDFDHLKSQEILNLNNLQNGLYILQLNSGEHIETFKLKKN